MNRNILLLRKYIGLLPKSYRCYCSNIKDNEPIKFSSSLASRRVLSHIRTTKSTAPWYQPYVVSASVAVFLIYFCILREENDVDLEFTKTLYERVEGLEKVQLVQSYQYNKENNRDTTGIEERLKEIEATETKSAA